ncbi:MAG: hypothetical protein KJO07_06205, partial [Deltaproteobacteria bacterium]|nr:hypothetical protein [Deltaproteobacteria bacterium]
MRALLAATVVLLGCQDRMAPGSSPAPTEPSPPPREVTERPPVAEVDLGMARFIRRNPDSLEVSPLRVSGFAVRIDDLGGVARTTIEVEIGNDSGAVAEAVVQIPLSPGAAVVGGALWVGGDSVPAVFAPAEAADDQSGAPRRYPMSVSWERGAVLIEIYPMPAKGTRRFELTWVEAIGDGSYRLPVLANDGQVVAVANPVEVDGKPATVRDGLVTLGA